MSLLKNSWQLHSSNYSHVQNCLFYFAKQKYWWFVAHTGYHIFQEGFLDATPLSSSSAVEEVKNGFIYHLILYRTLLWIFKELLVYLVCGIHISTYIALRGYEAALVVLTSREAQWALQPIIYGGF